MIRPTHCLIVLAGLAANGCDRPHDPPSDRTGTGKPAPRSIEQQSAPPVAKPAPRSIMRPAVATPEPAPPPAPPPIVTIPFGDPGPGLSDAQKALLDGVVTRLTGNPDRAIIRGSTDSHGGDRRNRLVSRRRARLVADYLVGKGIARDRLTVVALGEDRPIAPNAHPDGSDDPQARARNRRVDIEMIVAAPAPAQSPVADEDQPNGQ
jgi:OOP family OmpA-OmpF porin